MPKSQPLPKMQIEAVHFQGGLDTVTPQDNINLGSVIKAVNFEANITGGYRRVDGFTKLITAAVPGTGNILGVWYYKGNPYAFRNNGSGAVVMYKGDVVGNTWTVVPFYSVLTFNAGIFAQGDLAVGDTLTGKTSGTVGTIKKIIKYAGSYGVDAQGYIVVQLTSGTGYTAGEPIEKVPGYVAIVSATSYLRAISQSASALTVDGRVLLTGGFISDVTAEVSLGTVSGNTIAWVATTPLPVARYRHTLTRLTTGAFLIIGGMTASGATFTSCMGTVSGDSVRWVDSTPIPAARYNHAAVLLSDGRILAGGGLDATHGASAECVIGTVDGTQVTWTLVNTLPDYLYGHSFSLLADGRVLLIGGRNNTTVKSTVYIGTISGNTVSWMQAGNTPVPLYQHGAIVISSIYMNIIGGRTTGDTPLSDVYIAAISGNTITWTSGVSMPIPLDHNNCLLLSDNRPISIVGKTSADANTDHVYIGTPSGGVIMKAVSNSAPITLNYNASMKMKFVNYNFYASTDTFNMYWCDGINPAYEFDGTLLTPILMPTLPDAPFNNAPKAIAAHNGYLWLAFAKGSLQKSVIGEPLNWSGFLGAAEYGLGYEITDIISVLDTSLMIMTEHDIHVMTGKTESDFTLSLLSADTSCLPNTAKVSVRPLVTTSKGIIRLDSTQSYGNFQSNSVSRMITNLLNTWTTTKTIVGAAISRYKNQYRLYFTDGTGLILTQDALYADQNLPAFTTFNYGISISCIASIQDDATVEMLLFGGSTGYVYKEFAGNSFDGQPIPALLVTPFLNLKSKSVRKAFKRIEFDVENITTSDLTMSYCFSEGQSHTFKNVADSLTTTAASTTWSESNWGGESVAIPIASEQVISMTGTGHSLAVAFSSNSATVIPFTISNLMLSYLPRRLNRG